MQNQDNEQKIKVCTDLLAGDHLGDAGPAVNVRAGRDDGQPDRLQTHGALLVKAAGQDAPQLLHQALPQLRWRPSTTRWPGGRSTHQESCRLLLCLQRTAIRWPIDYMAPKTNIKR